MLKRAAEDGFVVRASDIEKAITSRTKIGDHGFAVQSHGRRHSVGGVRENPGRLPAPRRLAHVRRMLLHFNLRDAKPFSGRRA